MFRHRRLPPEKDRIGRSMNESPDYVAELLRGQLRQPLPGREAQRRFAPELSFGRHSGPPAHDTRSAAVIALLYRSGRQWKTPLIVRPDHSPTHPGQVSFPGGISEPGESVEQTALRELYEEIGIAVDRVEVLGRLSPIYVFNSNFLVRPVVGVATGTVRFTPCPSEVDRVLEVPLTHLLDERNHGRHAIRRLEIEFSAPHIQFERYKIWGATSMMMAELLEVLKTSGVTQSGSG